MRWLGKSRADTIEPQDWKSRLPLIRDRESRAPIRVDFDEWQCHVMMERYQDGGLSLRLGDDEGPIARATANVPGVSIAEDQVLIKDYSENEGVLQALSNAGLLSDTGRTVPSGDCLLHVAQLSDHVYQQWRAFQRQSQMQR